MTAAAQERLTSAQHSVTLPVGRRETLARLARLETAAGINRFIAELATAAAADIEVSLVDARSLPWTASRASSWWPPEVEAYACLRWGPWVAPFCVVWDRADAPPIHRRKRVAAWYSYAQSQSWDIPSILIVCPSPREAEEWAQAVTNSADRRGCPLLSVFLSTTRAALADPMGANWVRVDDPAEAVLCDRLRWVPEETDLTPQEFNLGAGFSQLATAAMPLRNWAAAVGNDPNGVSRAERIAALSLTTDPLHKTMLEWVGHHALLSSSDLSTLMGVREPLAEKLLGGLVKFELAQSIPTPESAGALLARYVLTVGGLRLLAARDGVPTRRYVRYGVLAAPGGGKKSHRLETLVRQFEHTVGTNSFFVRLKRDVDAIGGRLLRWLNASEATRPFIWYGKGHWLRPDGFAEIELDGKVHRIFLEWDRGTIRCVEHLTQKFQRYSEYFALQPETAGRADLLIVTVTPRRESVLWNEVNGVFGGRSPSCVLTTIDSLVDRLGPLATIWRSSDSTRRVSWHDHGGA
ncbi:MAG: replication-relaxation family protein [Dehalococcoidia bacterium]